MIVKVMDVEDANAWKNVCEHVRAAFDLAEGLPKILEDGEDYNREFLEGTNSLEAALDGVIKEGLYPAYIPTNAL